MSKVTGAVTGEAGEHRQVETWRPVIFLED